MYWDLVQGINKNSMNKGSGHRRGDEFYNGIEIRISRDGDIQIARVAKSY